MRGERHELVNRIRFSNHKTPYKAKEDHPDWTQFKMTDESWAQWRKENSHEIPGYAS